MSRIQTEALLLRVVDYGESDRIVHLLTPEQGRLTAIAKSARKSVKRFPGTLDVFNALDVTVDRRRPDRMAYLEKARLVSAFLGLRERPARYALASYVLELMDRMAPEDGAHPDTRRIYAFTRDALELISGAEPDRRLRVLIELRALDALGLKPELDRCVRCGEFAGDGGRRLPRGGRRRDLSRVQRRGRGGHPARTPRYAEGARPGARVRSRAPRAAAPRTGVARGSRAHRVSIPALPRRIGAPK